MSFTFQCNISTRALTGNNIRFFIDALRNQRRKGSNETLEAAKCHLIMVIMRRVVRSESGIRLV